MTRTSTTPSRRRLALAGFLLASLAAAGVATAMQGSGVPGFSTEQSTTPSWAPR